MNKYVMNEKIKLLDNPFNTCSDRKVINFDIAEMWLNLAETLLRRYMQNHDGGFETQVEILNAFKNVELYTKERGLMYHAMKGKGLILRMMGNGKESAESFEKMSKCSSNSSDKALVSHYYGLSLQMTNQLDRAISVFYEGLRECPDTFDIYLPLTESLVEKKCFSTENFTQLYVEILINVMRVFLKRKIPADENDTVERYIITSILLPTTVLQARNLMQLPSSLFYAFHKIAHELGEYDLAWKQLCIAHKIQSTVRAPYEPERYRNHLSCIKQVFSKEFMGNKENVNRLRANSDSAVSSRPIFIVGMMRSGSTLLELLLDSHSKIVGLGEDSVFNSMLPEFRNSFLAAAKSQQSIIPDTMTMEYISNNSPYEDDIGSSTFSQPSTRSQMVIQEYSARIEKRMLDRTAFIQNLPHQNDEISSHLNARVSFENPVDTKERSSTKKVYMVDKMLFNYRNLGFIHMLFPDAVILNLVRDPMDTLLSCLRNKFDGNDLEWALDPLHLSEEYLRYLDYIAHWKQVLPTGRVMDIQYESLVSSPEQVLKSIIEDMLHLEWESYILVNAQALRYADFLQPLINILRPELFKMLTNGELPKAATVNWQLSKSFAYNNVSNYENEIITTIAKIDDKNNYVDDNPNANNLNGSFHHSNYCVYLNSKLGKDIVLSILTKKIIPLTFH